MNNKLRFLSDKSLKDLSTFGIGGPARYFIEVTEIDQMKEVILYCLEAGVPYIVIGKGSNCLFDDRGFDGLVILNKISFCTINGTSVHVGAGYSFSLLGVQTARQGLSGLEFACGIPASVGGAVYMNAGASGQETKDFLTEVTYIDDRGQMVILSRSDMTFSYRKSSFQQVKGAIVAAAFLLPSSQAQEKSSSVSSIIELKLSPTGRCLPAAFFVTL